MKRMLIDQQAITTTQVEETGTVPLQDGQARLRLQSCALTANNVTYAASGFAIGYWHFFPSGIDGQGLLPVWGTAQVVESRSDALVTGTRLYGFFPLTEEVLLTPERTDSGTIVDMAEHRAALPAVYNRYAALRDGTAQEDHMRALLQPLLATSWLLSDWLADNGFFGAEQTIIGSASSKTGLGLCKYLAEAEPRQTRIVGLTADANRSFVEGLGACDQVLSYDEVDRIAKVPSVYVDMSGNGAVKLALHEVLGDQLKHSAAVGISHWDKFAPKQALPGVKPEFFFAPAQIAKRRQEWGPGVVEKQITAAWKRVAQDASDWMQVMVHKGLPEAQQVYADLAQGRADPGMGHIIELA